MHCLEIEIPKQWEYPTDKVAKDCQYTLHRIWSLYEMVKFSGKEFFYLSAILQGATFNLAFNRENILEDIQREETLLTLGLVDHSCKNMGLSLSSIYINDAMISALNDRQIKKGQLSDMFGILQGRIGDELKLSLFMQIPKEKIDYFDKGTKLFGEKVSENFPSTITNIEEAGKCYATDRNTACVFHLMGVLEIGLDVVCKALGIAGSTNRSWHSKLDKIKKESQAKYPSGEMADFYSGVATFLSSLKDAWRNPTMHVVKTYSSEEALDIFNVVKGFMNHLAKKLKE